MNNKTDLQAIKQIAKGLLKISILETEYTPIIVSHPFTKCGIVTLFENGEFVHLDITKSEEALAKWQGQVEKQIDEARSVYDIYYMVNDAYHILFFTDIAKHLSKEDFSSLLGSVWVGSDYANSDANVSKKTLLEYFKTAEKTMLMSESELEAFNDLDDLVIVYRGLSGNNKNNINALSWTTSFGKAKWFAERWGESGVIYSAIIDKKDIYAYFDRKNEDEVVVDYNKLKNIKVANKPLSKQESNLKTTDLTTDFNKQMQ